MEADSPDHADPAYSHKPSLTGAAWEFRLRDDALDWGVGFREGRIPYRSIRRVRLSFRPVTMQMRRFVTEVWSTDGPKLTIASTSWRSLLEQEAKDDAYGAFIRELHRRLAAAKVPATFERGSPAVLYWPGLVIFAGAGLGLAALTARALQEQALAAAVVIGGFFALFLWQSGNYFRRNRPGRYRPDALPDDLVPGGSA
jgi:hypothetical protein